MLSNTLFLESKIEKANDDAKLDKVRGGGGGVVTSHLATSKLATNMLSKSPPKRVISPPCIFKLNFTLLCLLDVSKTKRQSKLQSTMVTDIYKFHHEWKSSMIRGEFRSLLSYLRCFSLKMFLLR